MEADGFKQAVRKSVISISGTKVERERSSTSWGCYLGASLIDLHLSTTAHSDKHSGGKAVLSCHSIVLQLENS